MSFIKQYDKTSCKQHGRLKIKPEPPPGTRAYRGRLRRNADKKWQKLLQTFHYYQ